MMRGIRSAGDDRPFSIQLGYPKSISTDNPYWAERVSWNFVYTYLPTYRAVLEAYARTPPIPAMFGEGNYERENNDARHRRHDRRDPAPPDAVGAHLGRGRMRSTAATTGSSTTAGRTRLDTAAVAQLGRLRDCSTRWPGGRLVPDTASTLVTAGRGTELTDDTEMDVLDNDYVTAARSPDGTLAVVYVPTARTITLDPTVLASGATADWVDPVDGTRQAVPLAGSFDCPGPERRG